MPIRAELHNIAITRSHTFPFGLKHNIIMKHCLAGAGGWVVLRVVVGLGVVVGRVVGGRVVGIVGAGVVAGLGVS